MYKAKILGKRYVTEARDVVEVRMSKCLSSYKPGQHIRIYIDCDDAKRFREMNLTSIPDDDHLSFAFRVSDSIWKRRMMMLKPMDEVSINGPYGIFTLPDKPSRIGMIASGIGVTPLISMVRYSIRKSMHEIALLYINKDRDTAPYIDELESLACNNFRLFELFSYSLKDIDEWIKDMSKDDYDDRVEYWYVSGEPANVRAIRQMLLNSGIQSTSIKTEEFTGY
ncbi:MAG: FAD-dependent oxidoreductase [Candidatus Nitrosocaldus sp.]